MSYLKKNGLLFGFLIIFKHTLSVSHRWMLVVRCQNVFSCQIYSCLVNRHAGFETRFLWSLLKNWTVFCMPSKFKLDPKWILPLEWFPCHELSLSLVLTARRYWIVDARISSIMAQPNTVSGCLLQKMSIRCDKCSFYSRFFLSQPTNALFNFKLLTTGL